MEDTRLWVLIAATLLAIIWVGYFLWSKRTIQATECHHTTHIQGPLSAFGETVHMRLPLKEDGTTYYCHACLGKMTIKCAWCARPIFIGNLVTLYLANDIPLPEGAREYTHENGLRAFVGCLDCEQGGGVMNEQGIWRPPGEVERIPSRMELAMAALQSGASAVIIRM